MAVEQHIISDSVPALFRENMRVKDIREDRNEKCVEITIELLPEYLDQYGNMHGSVLAFLSIIAAEATAKMFGLSEEGYLVALSHTTNFISQPEMLGDLVLRSCVAGKGERVIHVHTIVECEGRELANALTMFVVEQRV